jgi:transposase
MKFITVVSNLDTGEPLWFGQDRKQETLDEFFRRQLRATQRKRVEAACVASEASARPRRNKDQRATEVVDGRVDL